MLSAYFEPREISLHLLRVPSSNIAAADSDYGHKQMNSHQIYRVHTVSCSARPAGGTNESAIFVERNKSYIQRENSFSSAIAKVKLPRSSINTNIYICFPFEEENTADE